ncbi:hypothetical protein [Moraxella lacunata]|uniref:hypothetical protein n=1 Tax=Moraxella lacunata TaxID=477 RepID=UPI003EE16C8E
MHSTYITLWRRNIDNFLGRLVDKLTPKDNNIINIIILSICKRDNTHTITSKIIAKIFFIRAKGIFCANKLATFCTICPTMIIPDIDSYNFFIIDIIRQTIR